MDEIAKTFAQAAGLMSAALTEHLAQVAPEKHAQLLAALERGVQVSLSLVGDLAGNERILLELVGQDGARVFLLNWERGRAGGVGH